MDKDFAFLEGWEAEDVAALLADELPATIATALKALSREMNTKVFLKLPPEIRNEVASAMATAKVPGSLLDVMRGDIAAGLRDKAASFRRPGAAGRAGTNGASVAPRVARPAPAGGYAPAGPAARAGGRSAPGALGGAAAKPENPLGAMLANLSPQLRHSLEAAGVAPAGEKTGAGGRGASAAGASPLGGDFGAAGLRPVNATPESLATNAGASPLGGDFAAAGLRPVNAAPETPVGGPLGGDFGAAGLRPINAAPDMAPGGPGAGAWAGDSAGGLTDDGAAGVADGLRRRSAMEQISLARQQLRGAAPAASAGGRLEMERFRRKAIDEELARARQLAHRGGPQKIDGMALAASIVRQAGAAVSDNLHQAMPQLYRQLRQRMFVFDDLVNSPDRTLTILFAVLRPEVAAIALRFGPDRLMERVMALLPARQAGRIKDAIAGAPPQVRLGDIEQAQKGIIDLAMQLQAKGKLVIDPDDPDLV